jgi:hypothetical protein
MEDATVLAWGENGLGQTSVPMDLRDVTAIAAGNRHSLALRRNGTVVAWGDNFYGQSEVPAGLTSVVAMAAGGWHNLALKHDGTVVAWGRNDEGQTTVPPGLDQVVAVAAGDKHSLALRSDGTVVGWGASRYARPPDDLNRVVAIVAGGPFNMAFRDDGTFVVWPQLDQHDLEVLQELGPVTGAAIGDVRLVITPGIRPRLMPVQLRAGAEFELMLLGQRGTSYTVQTSPDLRSWSVLTNFVAPASRVTVLDPYAGAQPLRFYRALSP